MNILLIGSNGQLGTDIMKVFVMPIDSIGILWNIKGVTQDDIDITDFPGIQCLIKEYKPDIIINTAAYHNVPECEKNPEQSFLVNTIAVRNLANLCRSLNIKLIHFSTDYVFDGKKRRPYHEDDIPNPLNVYAVSKLAGEFFVKLIPDYYLIRVASLFGTAGCLGKGGTNFVESILKNASCVLRHASGRPRPNARCPTLMEVTSNITSSPTYTYDAALKIKEMIQNNYPSGIYHLANSGFCTWYEFASEILRLSRGVEFNARTLIPVEEKEQVAGVRRPLFSALTSKKLTPLRPWQEALKHYLSVRKV